MQQPNFSFWSARHALPAQVSVMWMAGHVMPMMAHATIATQDSLKLLLHSAGLRQAQMAKAAG